MYPVPLIVVAAGAAFLLLAVWFRQRRSLAGTNTIMTVAPSSAPGTLPPLARDLQLFAAFAVLGTAVSYINVQIPHTDAYIIGRWIFGFLGVALLGNPWLALLLTAILCVSGPHTIDMRIVVLGNLMFAVPSVLVVRKLHRDYWSHLANPFTFGLAWILMILVCYQLFTTPVVWGILHYIDGGNVLQGILEGWRIQPYFLESVMVALISALAMTILQVHQHLRWSRQDHRLQIDILNQIQDSVVVTDCDGTVTYVNDAAVEKMGLTNRNEILGTSVLEFGDDPARGATQREIIDQTIANGQWRGEVVNYGANGQEIIFDCRTRLVCNENGKPEKLVGISTDITERRRTEEEREKLQEQLHQSQKLESVGRLAGGIAHDFNNLLMGIMNYVTLCRDEVGSNHTIAEWLDEITEECNRSTAMVRQLLTFARREPIHPCVIDVNETISSIMPMLHRLLGEGINLQWHPGNEVCPIKMDTHQIEQVLTNLLVNAKAAIEDTGTISVKTNKSQVDADFTARKVGIQPGDYLLLTVSDDGCGMDDELKEKIFEPFFTTRTRGEGTGLGLSTVHGIVKQNNGAIDVYSEPGKGTTFRIYLPCCGEKIQPGNETVLSQECKGGSETILLVEDDKSVRETTCMFLEDLGYTVMAAEKPSEALRLEGENEPIDLLITDVVLPEMNGRQLHEKLSEILPDMRCLYVSGYTANVIKHHGVVDKEVQLLEKPFGKPQLARKIREILDAPV